MRHVQLLTLVFVLLLALPAFADFQVEQWQFNKPLSASREGLTLTQLDKEILKHTRQDLADIRIVSEQGRELPYQIVPFTGGEIHGLGTYVLENVGIINHVTGKDFTSLTFNLLEPTVTNCIVLDIDSEDDYLREVIIEGSADNKNWSLIKKDKIFSVGSAIKDTELLYPTVDFRLVRVTIQGKDEKPLVVNEASINYIPVADQDLTSLPATLLKTEQAAKHTIVDLDLAVKGYNLDHLELQIEGRNYQRQVEAFHSFNGSDWIGLGSSSIYQHQWSEHQVTHTAVALKQNCGRYLRLIIHNQDSPPLMIKGVAVWGQAPKLLVDLPAGKHRIWYGNPEAKMVNYDVQQFSHLVQKQDLPVIAPEEQQVNENYKPQEKPWTERNRWLLNAAIISVALLLGLIIINNMKNKR